MSPPTMMLEIDKVEVPVLVTLTYCDWLHSPVSIEPNTRLVGVEPGKRLVAEMVTESVAGAPVPVSEILSGESGALSVIVTDAVEAPRAVGSKCPWMEQLAPGARLVPQLLEKANSGAFVPVTAMLVIARAAVPVLVSVTDCDSAGVFKVVEPKARLGDDRLTSGCTPVPLRVMLCGELLSLSMRTTDAVSAPVTVGAKCPWMMQLAPAARLAPQSLAKSNDEAFPPVTAMLVNEIAVPPVLVTLTCCSPVDVPTFAEPNGMLVRRNTSEEVGVNPVPLNKMVWGELAALSVMTIDAEAGPATVGWKCSCM